MHSHRLDPESSQKHCYGSEKDYVIFVLAVTINLRIYDSNFRLLIYR
jgi:hypothetical protein